MEDLCHFSALFICAGVETNRDSQLGLVKNILKWHNVSQAVAHSTVGLKFKTLTYNCTLKRLYIYTGPQYQDMTLLGPFQSLSHSVDAININLLLFSDTAGRCLSITTRSPPGNVYFEKANDFLANS